MPPDRRTVPGSVGVVVQRAVGPAAFGRADGNTGVAVPAVSVEHLSKSYGDTVAVRDVSFEVQKGEVFALLGPERSRQDDHRRDPRGVPRPDRRARCETLGVDPADHSTQRWLRTRIGVVLQELAVEPYYSVRQVLTRNAGYYPNPRPVDEVIELIGLAREGATTASSGCRAASSAGSTSASGSSATPTSSSSTSPRPASTRRGGGTPGISSGAWPPPAPPCC